MAKVVEYWRRHGDNFRRLFSRGAGRMMRDPLPPDDDDAQAPPAPALKPRQTRAASRRKARRPRRLPPILPGWRSFWSPPRGLKDPLADEARQHGFDAQASPAVSPLPAVGRMSGARTNLKLRGATRVLACIGAFRAMHPAQLDKRAPLSVGRLAAPGRAPADRGHQPQVSHLSRRRHHPALSGRDHRNPCALSPRTRR